MNKIFYFYNKLDSTMEPINKCSAASEKEALAIFTERKQLSESDFLAMYNINIFQNEYKRKTNKAFQSTY